MPAILRLSGALRNFNGGKSEVQVQPGHTVREIITGLGIVPETIAVVVVNQEQQDKDYIIQEGDDVLVMAIIGGG
jgi:sulfur carrier protein ThiS